jgi:hypothetical protein
MDTSELARLMGFSMTPFKQALANIWEPGAE